MNKDISLKNAGFLRLPPSSYVNHIGSQTSALEFVVPASDVRYMHESKAKDGTSLFVYAWLDEGYMLTTQQDIGSPNDIVAKLESDESDALMEAVEDFFYQHGGRGPLHYA